MAPVDASRLDLMVVEVKADSGQPRPDAPFHPRADMKLAGKY